MNVYDLRAAADDYQCLVMTQGDLFEFARRFNGTPMVLPWTDVTIEVYSKAVPKGDFPSLIPDVPVFSRRAVEALADLLQGNGEALPISLGEEEYYLYNVTRVVDALDLARSEILLSDDGLRVLMVKKYAFSEKLLLGLTIFKLPEAHTGTVLVTDAFVDRVRSKNLKGFWFPAVWSSGDVPLRAPRERW